MDIISSKIDMYFYKQRKRYQEQMQAFYHDFSDFSFKGKFQVLNITDTNYSKIIKNYTNYDGINLIQLTSKLIRQSQNYAIKYPNYPTKAFRDFENMFFDLKDQYGHQISLRAYLDRQTLGENGEEQISDILTKKSGITPLRNIQLPCYYLMSNGKTYLGSNQIDIILICNYGVFSLESKNFNVDGISIESPKTNGLKRVWSSAERRIIDINSQYLHVYKNGADVTKYPNDIGAQTYFHKQAIIDALGNDPNNYFNKSVLNYKVYSVLVYANNERNFYLGNHSNVNKLSNWEVKGLSINKCWEWIKSHDKENLNRDEINSFRTTLSQLNNITREKLYYHMVIIPDHHPKNINDFKNLENYKNFLYKWLNFNQQFKN